MNRAYIFCHMMSSLDGIIMGNYMDTPEGAAAGDVFYNLSFGMNAFYKHQRRVCGGITTDDNFTFYEKPDLDENAAKVPEGDYIAKKTDMYYVSIDPSGRLGWKSSTLTYIDTTAHVIEVLTEKATNAYKAFLRRLGISYIIAGSDSHDYEQTLSKLKEQNRIENLMLGGGAALNWSFIQAGMCDEVSVMIAAVADGSANTQTLFMTREGMSDDTPVAFKLQEAKVMDGDSIWLRYLVKNVKEN